MDLKDALERVERVRNILMEDGTKKVDFQELAEELNQAHYSIQLEIEEKTNGCKK